MALWRNQTQLEILPVSSQCYIITQRSTVLSGPGNDLALGFCLLDLWLFLCWASPYLLSFPLTLFTQTGLTYLIQRLKGLFLFFFSSFFYFLKLFYCCSITVVCIFSPHLSPTPAKPTSLPCFHPPPWFCLCPKRAFSPTHLTAPLLFYLPNVWSVFSSFSIMEACSEM